FGRFAGGIELEQVGARPDLRTIVCDINGNISHDPNAACTAVTLQRSPLAKKFKLSEFVEVDLAPQAVARCRNGAGLWGGECRLPIDPDRLAAEGFFQGHEERIILKP